VRAAWHAATLLTVVVFLFHLAFQFGRLQTMCVPPRCAPNQFLDAGTLAAQGISPTVYAVYQTGIVLLTAVLWWLVAALIAWRAADDWLAMLAALMLVTNGLPTPYVDLAAAYPMLEPALLLVEFLTDASIILFCYLFPDGTFTPRWTRWAAGAWLVFDIGNVFFRDTPLDLQTWPEALFLPLYIAGVLSLPAAQIARFRGHSNATQRQQTKWVVFGLTVGAGGFLASELLRGLFPSHVLPGSLLGYVATGFTLCVLMIPLSIGVAILHARLWDIDVIINRTLVYGALTVLLVLVYFGSVALSQWLVRRLLGVDTVLVKVVSTLACAALFQPLRRHVQTLIDRRFYRRKYDAATTLAAFTGRLRYEVDMRLLSEELVAVVEDTLQPAHVSLWIRPLNRGRDADGQEVADTPGGW
jgi:hypothetical protein